MSTNEDVCREIAEDLLPALAECEGIAHDERRIIADWFSERYTPGQLSAENTFTADNLGQLLTCARSFHYEAVLLSDSRLVVWSEEMVSYLCTVVAGTFGKETKELIDEAEAKRLAEQRKASSG